MANLTLENEGKQFFSKDKEIIPYIDKHWESLTSMPRRIKLTWHNTVAKTMVQFPAYLFRLRKKFKQNGKFATVVWGTANSVVIGYQPR